jgi:hypothetical protein
MAEEEAGTNPNRRRRFRRLGRTVRCERLILSNLWLVCLAILQFGAVVRSFSLLDGRCRLVVGQPSVLVARLASSSGIESDMIDPDDDAKASDLDVLECSTELGSKRAKQKSDVKLALLKVAATHYRGFGAGIRAREDAAALLRQLEGLNEETFASRGIDGPARSRNSDVEKMSSSSRSSRGPTNDFDDVSSPLKGCWKLIWTTAWDVLSLEASPFTKTAAIYQVYDPPTITNVIDVMPKIQAAFPTALFPSSLLRLQVETIGSSPPPPPQPSYDGDDSTRNRIGLEFRTVQARPLQILGTTLDVFPPLRLSLPTLPRLDPGAAAAAAATPLLSAFLPASLLDVSDSLFGSSGSGSSTAAFDGRGYFDVTFVDEDFLVIRQLGGGGIGGLFALIKVDSIDP